MDVDSKGFFEFAPRLESFQFDSFIENGLLAAEAGSFVPSDLDPEMCDAKELEVVDGEGVLDTLRCEDLGFVVKKYEFDVAFYDVGLLKCVFDAVRVQVLTMADGFKFDLFDFIGWHGLPGVIQKFDLLF